MNQEQLATIRAHYSDQSEAINPGHNVTVNALLDHIAQLEAHKAESMQVFASLQIQAIAKEIGAPLGSGAPEQILPWIKATKAQLEAQADESSATMERLSGVVERYRGGMQPSSAERCTLRWSHSSATDRGSFDRGWEAREAEGLEAQRGGAVVVPEFDWDKAHEKAKTLFESYDDLSPVIYANGGAEWYKLALSYIHSVSANQVLADGEISMARAEISAAFKAGFDFSKDWRNHPSNSEYVNELFRLRSAKGEVEG